MKGDTNSRTQMHGTSENSEVAAQEGRCISVLQELVKETANKELHYQKQLEE